MKLGILPLGRQTFDVPFAQAKLALMLTALEATGHEITGPRELLFDEEATQVAIRELLAAEVDQVVILQVTFTDASMAVAAANVFEQPVSVWSVPEPRTGGRLRLNSFCGLNLTSHALGLAGRKFGWLYLDPDKDAVAPLNTMLTGAAASGEPTLLPPPPATEDGRRIANVVAGKRIARVGEHPAGFDTCAYDTRKLKALAGVDVDELQLDDLFNVARAIPDATAAGIRTGLEGQLAGLDQVNQDELDRSLRLKAGLNKLQAEHGYDAFAIRCWPETFTEYGGAVCGPAAMMGEARVPCACEADVYGALTQLILMETVQAPVFLTDLVDMDAKDDTGVVWHCGQAPLSMRDPDFPAEATIHTNRKQPLLFQFPLKPGDVTLMRISQARNEAHMVLAKAEMLKRPMAFTGTSGVLRFERSAGLVLNDIIDSGLEHHMALAYGDHRDALRGVAGAMNLPVLEL